MGFLNKIGLSHDSSVPDEPPPSYDESQNEHRQQGPPPPKAEAPSQPPPASPNPQASPRPPPAAAGPSQPPTIPRQFPPSFNLYSAGWPNASFILAEHQQQPLYLYSMHTGFSDAPPIILHSGPDESYQPLASANFMFMSLSFDVELPPIPGSGAPLARERVDPAGSSGLSPAFTFSIEVGPNGNGPRETFEWRRSSGQAVASLGGHYHGWKLVRLAQGPPGGGNMDFVPGGFRDSFGNEVVAAWAMGSGRSLTKVAHYQFMGTGLTGLLGERWAIMTVITGLTLFQRDRRRR